MLLAVTLLASCLSSGPMLGYSELNEAGVWLQTKVPCRVQLRYWKSGDTKTARLSDLVETNGGADYIARFRLQGLEFGTEYEYELYLDGIRAELPYTTSLKSRPKTPSSSFRVVVGSCAYINDPVVDDEPDGGDYQIFDSIAKQRPDLMLWIGDNVYFRGPDFTSEPNMRHRYAHDRALPEMQRLLAATRHYATWDDHDYGPNDSDRTFEGKEAAARVFRDYWMNGGFATEHAGVYGKFVWNDVEFFLLDDRTFRSPNQVVAADKVMFGAEQMQWLIESLRASGATFKVVIGGNQMMNPIAMFEGWTKFPREQQRFLDSLREQHIEGVFFLTGDRHQTELIRRNESGLYPLYDLTSSPLTSGPGSAQDKDNPARVPGTLVAARNFCTLSFEGPEKDRVVVIASYDPNGKQLWQQRIRVGELRFK